MANLHTELVYVESGGLRCSAQRGPVWASLRASDRSKQARRPTDFVLNYECPESNALRSKYFAQILHILPIFPSSGKL